jgi:hypothetical protein
VEELGVEGGKDWSERYFKKAQFHDEFKVEPIPSGTSAANISPGSDTC